MTCRTRDLWICSTVAIGLVVFRSYAMLAFEQLDFDSDQAIVGLMAKHLSEFRTFPLFFYGQHYMLGVEAWIAAPFFWVGGPSVATLRLPLVLVNCAVAVWLTRSIARTVGSPWLALAAVLPFAAATPILSAQLLETLGASVEPFLYVLILWALRERPVLFGVVLGVGFLHREFTVFAILGVAVGTWSESDRSVLTRSPWLFRATGAFAAIWLVVDQLKRRINALGPAGGAFDAAPLWLQLQLLFARISLDPTAVLGKLRQAFAECLPDLLGMRGLQPLRYNINASTVVGSVTIGLVLLAVAAVCFIRLATAWAGRRNDGRSTRPSPFAVFIAVVGVQALFVYALSDAVDPAAVPILRYALLALLLPIALVVAFFEVERRRDLRIAVALLLAFGAASSVRDTWRVIDEYRRTPPPSEHRVLADDLVAHRVRYGTAIYWDAYVTDFLARERVILNSTDTVRIGLYETLVKEHPNEAVKIVREPCTGGRRVASWCVVDPTTR